MRIWIVAVVMMVAMSVTAGPKPLYPYTTEAGDMKALAGLIEANIDKVESILEAYKLGSGGAGIAADITAAVEVQKEEGIIAHLKRNWGKYTTGLLTSVAVVVSENNDWWDDGGSAPTTVNYNLDAGRDIVIGDGNDTGSQDSQED